MKSFSIGNNGVKKLNGGEFENAVKTYGDTVYRTAYHALGNKNDAEDIMQTVFLRLYSYSKRFESEEHIKAWLLRVTVNECRKEFRSSRRKRNVPLDERRDEPVFDDTALQSVFDCVMSLDPKYRIAVYLHYYEDKTVAEISGIMGAKQSTVQTWLQRGREKLREITESEE